MKSRSRRLVTADLIHRFRFRHLAAVVLSVCLIQNADTLAADEKSPDVIRVEEDWRVEIGVPSPGDDAPQIVTVISPGRDLEREHAIFELNHSTIPDFFAGGMQLQLWYKDDAVFSRNFPRYHRLAEKGEIVEFTSSMELKNDRLKFEIRNGSSKTWGKFGGQGYLTSRIPSRRVDLNSYDPAVSAQHSRVGFASTRVRRLVLKEVRRFSADGLISKDSEQRIVHEHLSD